MRPELVQVVEVLAGIASGGRFATRIELDPGVLWLSVKGAGRIRLPVDSVGAKALIRVAKPAKYGKGTATLTDRRVRDTWVVPKSQITIDPPWQPAEVGLLAKIRDRLGLPATTTLHADLHDLLVYEPGQFFVPHQDSEKHDDMIGTLVVMLPSISSGGVMEIVHHDARLVVRGSAKKLVCAAFYGDCRHEVTPVTSGYRVVLTFILRAGAPLVGRGGAPAVAAGVTERLASEVRAHFDAPVRPKYDADERRRSKPDRLVFLLDHEYTSRGLDWARLKNGDALRAAALRDAADRIDCDVRLALADVHESWMCETDYDPRRWSRRGRRGLSYEDAEGVTNDDGYRTDDPAHPDLVDLYETQVELRDPDDASGRGRKALERVDFDDEVCWLRPSSEVRPFQWSHEGYTGNEGDTVDRWYHRGAVVLTPRSRRFVLLAKRSPARALADLGRVLRGAEPARAEPMLREMLPSWAEAVRDATTPALVVAAARVAARVREGDEARGLLEVFDAPVLGTKIGEALAVVAGAHGSACVDAVLEAWGRYADRVQWLGGAADLCTGLVATREGAAVAAAFVAAQWRGWSSGGQVRGRPRVRGLRVGVIANELDDDVASDSERGDVPRTLVAMLRASAIVGRADLQGEIVAWLRAREEPVPRLAIAVLRAAHRAAPALEGAAIAALASACLAKLEQRLEVPVREASDWSIGWDDGCGCELCEQLAEFLEDDTTRRVEWPLAKERRRHVHGRIDAADLPVSHVTRRSGSPYVLVVEKTRALFEREGRERRSCAAEVRWLRARGRR